MHIVITGGLGYVGQHLADELTGAGHRVTVFGRSLRPTILRDGQVDFIPADIMHLEGVTLAADALIHLACANGSGQDAKLDYDLTVGGTRRVVAWAESRGIPRFMFFSTIQVYGDLHGRTIDESSPTVPVNDYGLSHLLAEQIAGTQARSNGTRAALVRPTIIYGGLLPEVPRWTITPGCFCQEAVTTGKIVVRSGTQYRNYIPMSYVRRALLRYVETWDSRDAVDVLNVAGAETLTVADLARRVQRITENVLKTRIDCEIHNDDKEYQAFQIKTDKLCEVAGKAPPVELDQEILGMVERLVARGPIYRPASLR